MKLNGVTITPETVQATRQWYADNAQACIDDAKTGVFRVNDLPEYIAWQESRMSEVMCGKWDHSLSFVQRAYYIQTGESVPILA